MSCFPVAVTSAGCRHSSFVHQAALITQARFDLESPILPRHLHRPSLQPYHRTRRRYSCFWSAANSIRILARIVKIAPQAVLHKQFSSQMVELKYFGGKLHSNHLVEVCRILSPQFAGAKRNAAPFNLKIAGGVFHNIHMALSVAILSMPLKCLLFEVGQW